MKPTDSNTTLYFTSAHPKHCRQGMVYGQYLRLGRICFRLQDYITKALIKIKKFLKRGYPRDLLLKELIHAASMTGQSFCRPINHNLTLTNNHSSRFLSPSFHPAFKGLRHIVQDNWDSLGGSHKTRYLHDCRLVAGLRRAKSNRSLSKGQNRLQPTGQQSYQYFGDHRQDGHSWTAGIVRD